MGETHADFLNHSNISQRKAWVSPTLLFGRHHLREGLEMLWYYKKYKKMRDWWMSRGRLVAFGGTPDIAIFVILIPAIFAAMLNWMFGSYLSFGKNQFGIIWLTLVALVIVYLAICSFRDKG
jgi:hypothetical protein